jgi:hypothetical protein
MYNKYIQCVLVLLVSTLGGAILDMIFHSSSVVIWTWATIWAFFVGVISESDES